jgi:hypothetical protein
MIKKEKAQEPAAGRDAQLSALNRRTELLRRALDWIVRSFPTDSGRGIRDFAEELRAELGRDVDSE